MKNNLLLILILAVSSVGFSQSKSEKLDSIVNEFGFVDNQKLILLDYTIEPLKLEAKGRDSLKLIEMENQLTNDYIHTKIKSALSQSISDEDLNNIYNFIQTSTFEKYFQSDEFEKIISLTFSDIQSELKSIFKNIDEQKEAEENSYNFKPIPVNREDGFYATNNYKVGSEKNIELVREPALTKNEIQEITVNNNYFGDNILFITFTKEGANIFYQLTKENLGKPIAIVIDKKIISLPVVQEPIKDGKAVISGNFSAKELIEFKDRLTK